MSWSPPFPICLRTSSKRTFNGRVLKGENQALPCRSTKSIEVQSTRRYASCAEGREG